ncbi:hypothetical protein QQ045_020323 [Rhodiola kirilowii]
MSTKLEQLKHLILVMMFQPTNDSDLVVADLKKSIEAVQGSRVYPAFKQMLVYQGKVLKDDTTLKENKVAENSFISIMLTKSRTSAGEGSTNSSEPSSMVSQASRAPPSTSAPRDSVAPAPAASPSPALAPVSMINVTSEAGVENQAASNQTARSNCEETIQQIIDMGGGAWNRDIVIQALRAAFNNPERAVEYLYSGHPNVGSNASGTATLAFLRNSRQFQAMRAMVQVNPEIMQPMLQELGKQNPNLMRLIQEHQAEFHRLINEPVEGGEGNVMGEIASAMPQTIQVTPEERDAIERLEAMGFDRALVLEVFFACNRNESLAANYLLDHIHEFDD